MNRLTEAQLTEWEALAQPVRTEFWECPYHGEVAAKDVIVMDDYEGFDDFCIMDYGQCGETVTKRESGAMNPQLITEAPTAIPALVAEVRRLRMALDDIATGEACWGACDRGCATMAQAALEDTKKEGKMASE